MAVRAHERNNFDALRIVAALMVVFGHVFVLSGRQGEDLLVAHTGIGGFGELGVSVFFVVSGFLVTMSYDRLGDVRAFMANRLLRIVPGLLAATALTAWALGPAMTNLALADYFARPQTWLYPLRNTLLYPVAYRLPGVFAHNPYPEAVNGSLWTLRLEFTFYLVIPLMAWLRLLGRRGLLGLALAAMAVHLAAVLLGARIPPTGLIAARTFYLFAAGAALFAWREHRLVGDGRALAAASLLALVALPSHLATGLVAFTLLPLVVVGLALRPVKGVSAAARFGDLSYGTYIYAFPVQQTLMALLGADRLGIGGFFGLALACVLPLAFLSWWMVERPALALKGRVRARLSPGLVPTPIAAELP